MIGESDLTEWHEESLSLVKSGSQVAGNRTESRIGAPDFDLAVEDRRV